MLHGVWQYCGRSLESPFSNQVLSQQFTCHIMTSLEYKTYIACTASIARAIAPIAQEISDDFLERGVIPPNVAEKVRWEGSDEWKASELVSAIGATISRDSDAYHDFLEVLLLEKHYPDTGGALELLNATYQNGGVKPKAGKSPALLRDTGRRLARDAVKSAVRRNKKEKAEEQSTETRTIHVVLALVIVCVAVGAGIFTYHATDEGVGVCTKIKDVDYLTDLLQDVAKTAGITSFKICKNLDLPDEICTSTGTLTPADVSVQYLQQADRDCWEQVIHHLCHNFKLKKVAKEIAEKNEVPELPKSCSED